MPGLKVEVQYRIDDGRVLRRNVGDDVRDGPGFWIEKRLNGASGYANTSVINILKLIILFDIMIVKLLPIYETFPCNYS